MPTIPTHEDLWETFRASVEDDPETRLNDFTEGSVLDAFAGVSAAAARGIMRWVSRQMRRKFLSTAEGDDYEYVAVDYYGEQLQRRDDETLGEYQSRIEEYQRNGLRRATVDALLYYAAEIEGVNEVDANESVVTGVTTVEIAYDGDETDEATVLDAFLGGHSSLGDLLEWRAAGGPVEVELYEGVL